MAQLNFDATQVAPDAGQMDPIPAGWYNAQVTKSEVVPTKSGDGTGLMLKLCLKVLDGKHVGRSLFSQFNIRNSNPTAQEIAYKQLSAVAHAVGVLQVQDSLQLHGIPLKIRVKITPAVMENGQEKYAAKNEITAYKNINEQVQMADAVAGPVMGQAAPFLGQGMPAPQAMPAFANSMPAPQAAPAVIQSAPPQPWQQPAPVPAMQAATAPQMQAAPTNVEAQPAWAQAAAPVAQAAAPAPQMQASPPVDPNAVAQAQAGVPPWMQQR